MKIVNSWNEWDPLKRIIVGRPEGSNIPAPEPAWEHDIPGGGFPLGWYGSFPQEMYDAANEQMGYFIKVLENEGITVERMEIEPFMLNKPISTPDWTQLNSHGANNPRDVIAICGNYIVEATTSRRSRFYEHLNLRPIFERYFMEDPEVVYFAAPKPRLTEESFVKNYYYNYNNVWTDEEKRERLYNSEFHLTEKEPLWDAADIGRFGKDLFVLISCTTNKCGFDWIKRMFGALGFRVHAVQTDSPRDPEKIENYRPWHIDCHLTTPRPGLSLYNPDWNPRTPKFWELFKQNEWELVPAARPTNVLKNRVYLFGDYGEKSWISINALTIRPGTMCVEAHETDTCDQLDKLGVNVIPVPYNKVIPFAGSLHCTTLDIYREGELTDYFPKQVPDY